MGLFDFLQNSDSESTRKGVISGGKQKKDGSHDHRTNTGNDRTPAQKEADKNRSK
ncbi:UNVERIFIED_ORG: hypothetical protein M2355_001800 [Lelliottia amnigena]|jgi:hypothetical protein|nr:hypothetical protein [Lelliottia amnigena]